MEFVEDWLVSHGWQPANGFNPAATPPAPTTNGSGGVPVCPTHGKPMKLSQYDEGYFCPQKVAADDGTRDNKIATGGTGP
jgi:hypothetical protein